MATVVVRENFFLALQLSFDEFEIHSSKLIYICVNANETLAIYLWINFKLMISITLKEEDWQRSLRIWCKYIWIDMKVKFKFSVHDVISYSSQFIQTQLKRKEKKFSLTHYCHPVGSLSSYKNSLQNGGLQA